MTPEEIDRMRRNERKIVRIDCSDGEILNARILHVNDDHQDTIYDLISTTTPEKYKAGNKSAYVIRWSDIVTFTESDES
jgi:hypothetical protein